MPDEPEKPARKRVNLKPLWDEMALRVLTNTRDFDCREEDYPRKVRAVVWQTVRELRHGRQDFHAEIRRELRDARRAPASSKKTPPRSGGGGGPLPSSDAPPTSRSGT